MRTATCLGEKGWTRLATAFSAAEEKGGQSEAMFFFKEGVEGPLERRRQLLMEGKEPIDAAPITLRLK